MPSKLLVLTLFIPWICSVQLVAGEEINLNGEPGQGYVLEILIGTPPQKLNVIVDTGSSTLGVAASAKHAVKKFFKRKNSTSLQDSGYEVQEKFTEGGWVADLVTDFVQIPSLPTIPAVATDVALIYEANDFFINGSNWEGILGLAYPRAGATGPHVTVKPWLGFVNSVLKKPVSFSLKLCGARSQTNSSHYGSFEAIDETTPKLNRNKTFRTPILREIWYEVGTIAVRVVNHKNYAKSMEGINEEMCTELNVVKSIIDSGTSNLRIPESVYNEVVKQLQEAAVAANYVISNDFWHPGGGELGQVSCWPQPRVWNLPSLAIDLLSADNPNQYFTIELPPESYMHQVSPKKTQELNRTSSEFCYYLGVQSSGNTTILGVTVLEGLEVTFNTSAGYIEFQTSPCGPNVKITGPYFTTQNLLDLCQLHKTMPGEEPNSVTVAQWASVLSVIIAMTLLIVFMAPCFRAKFHSFFNRGEMNVSMSRAALVDY